MQLIETRLGGEPGAANQWSAFATTVIRVDSMWYYLRATEKAFRAHEPDPDRVPNVLPTDIVTDPKFKELLPTLREFLSELDQLRAFTSLDHLTPDSRCVAPRASGPLLDEVIDELGPLRATTALLLARMRLALIDDDGARAADSLRWTLNINRAALGRGSLISGLVAMAGRESMAHEIRRAVVAGTVGDREAALLLKTLTAHLSPIDLAWLFDCERCMTLDAIDWFFAEQAAGADVLKDVGVIAPRQEQQRLANRFFESSKAMLSDDRAIREAAREELAGIQQTIDASKDGARYEPLSTLMPALDKVRGTQRNGALHQSGTMIMLALEIHRAREGRYPQSLDELAPAIIPIVPKDPLAADGLFRYKRLAADGGSPRDGYILYSVGFDGEDNEGKEHPTHRITGLSPSGRGYDWVINSTEW